MARFSPPNTEGIYISTSGIYDSQLIQDIDINSAEFRDFLVRLQQDLNTFSLYLNQKTSGKVSTEEQLSGGLFFSTAATGAGQDSQIDRQEYHKVVNFGALPNATTKSVAHGIDVNANTIFTFIGGCANNHTGNLYIPLPLSSAILAENIFVSVDATNVNINTALDYSAWTTTYVILKYLKN